MTDDDDKTRFGAVPPPKMPGAPSPKPPAAEDDRTQIASPPPPPRMPGAQAPPKPTPPASDEHTQFGVAPPPGALKPPSAPPPAPPLAPARPATVSDKTTPPAASADDKTMIISDRALGMVRLQRVQPAGRSDVIPLDRASYTLGRSPACDIELFSPTASREHARIFRREGQWYVEAIERRDVSIDGKVVRHETPLANRMRVQLGDDELLFLDGGAAPQAAAAKSAGPPWVLIGVGAIVVLALVAWLVFGRGG